MSHLCNLTRLFTVGWTASNFHIDAPKIDNGQFQNCNISKSIYKKFSNSDKYRHNFLCIALIFILENLLIIVLKLMTNSDTFIQEYFLIL